MLKTSAHRYLPLVPLGQEVHQSHLILAPQFHQAFQEDPNMIQKFINLSISYKKMKKCTLTCIPGGPGSPIVPFSPSSPGIPVGPCGPYGIQDNY